MVNSNVLAPESVRSVWLNVFASVAKSIGSPEVYVVGMDCAAAAAASPIVPGVGAGVGVGVGVGDPVLWADQSAAFTAPLWQPRH